MKNNYTTIKKRSFLLVHPKILRLDMTKDVKHFLTSGKMLLSDHKKSDMFKAKRLIEKGIPATSSRCSDHLSRQFLIIASTFHTVLKIPQPNIFTHHQHASLL